MATNVNYQQPTCEDGSDSDDGRVFVESFAGRKSPNANAANVSTKRSHPSDLDKEKAPPKGRPSHHSDIRSDSGYSSYTAATVSSADSAPSAYSHPPPPPPQTSRPDPPTTSSLPQSPPQQKPRRPTVSDRKSSSASASANGSTNTSTSSAPRPQGPSRTASQSSKRAPGVQRRTTITQGRRDSRVQPDNDCDDPNCTKCIYDKAVPRARPELGPSQSARDVRPQHIPPDQRSMHSDPADYYATPPSPSYTRHQPMYMRGPAVVQPAPPRRRSSSTSRPRPQSYSGDPGAQYWAPGMVPPYPSPAQERGPPPSASAAYHRNMQQYQQMPPPMVPYGMQPQPGFYPPQFQTPPSFDMPQRPDMPSRGSYYGTRPQQPPPIVTQQDRREPQPGYSARYPPQSAIQGKTQLQLDDRSYESSESDDYSSEEEEYERNPRHALVPAQKLKRTKSQGQKQRPSLRHAATTQVIPERPKERERAGRTSNASTTRRPSVSRPRGPNREIHSAYDTPTARVIVNDSRDRRRQSAQVPDRVYEQYARAMAKQERQDEVRAMEAQSKALAEKYAKAKAREEELAKVQAMEERYARAKAREEELAKTQAMEEQIARTRALEAQYRERHQRRNSKVYRVPEVFDDDETEEDDYEEEDEYEVERSRPVIVRDGRRRPTDTASRKGKERPPQPKNKQMAAEDYINAKRGNAVPLVEQVHRAAKRGSRLPSAPSRSGSSGSDEQSQSARTDEVRLRVDNNAPISLQLKGDMGDRMLRLIPGENGTTDIVIANPNGGESVYSKSERGSVVGRNRRSMVGGQPRREAEEYTERSSRSNRSRREEREDREPQRHVLRRYRT